MCRERGEDRTCRDTQAWCHCFFGRLPRGRTALTMGLHREGRRGLPTSSSLGWRLRASITCPSPRTGSESIARTLEALELLFRSDVAPNEVAAIIIEPVQGEGGFLPAPHELLRKLRQVCDQHGILLIADEVQSGILRAHRTHVRNRTLGCRARSHHRHAKSIRSRFPAVSRRRSRGHHGHGGARWTRRNLRRQSRRLARRRCRFSTLSLKKISLSAPTSSAIESKLACRHSLRSRVLP